MAHPDNRLDLTTRSELPMSSNSYAAKGSQRWLQVAVDRAPALLDVPIRNALQVGDDVTIEWLSSVRSERFVEYRDGATEILLVEAKAHIPEIVSPRSRASEPARGRIAKSIRDVQQAVAPKSVDFVDWTSTFYQYANRIAHLHFLRYDNGVHLINIYFINATDVNGPTSSAEWMGAIRVVECYLGIGRTRLSKPPNVARGCASADSRPPKSRIPVVPPV